MPLVEQTCGYCSKPVASSMRCGRCKAQRYCGRNCQRQHWCTHKTTCRPPESTQNDNKSTHKNRKNPAPSGKVETIAQELAQGEQADSFLWGNSPGTDLLSLESNEHAEQSTHPNTETCPGRTLRLLLVGACDLRHVLCTLASLPASCSSSGQICPVVRLEFHCLDYNPAVVARLALLSQMLADIADARARKDRKREACLTNLMINTWFSLGLDCDERAMLQNYMCDLIEKDEKADSNMGNQWLTIALAGHGNTAAQDRRGERKENECGQSRRDGPPTLAVCAHMMRWWADHTKQGKWSLSRLCARHQDNLLGASKISHSDSDDSADRKNGAKAAEKARTKQAVEILKMVPTNVAAERDSRAVLFSGLLQPDTDSQVDQFNPTILHVHSSGERLVYALPRKCSSVLAFAHQDIQQHGEEHATWPRLGATYRSFLRAKIAAAADTILRLGQCTQPDSSQTNPAGVHVRLISDTCAHALRWGIEQGYDRIHASTLAERFGLEQLLKWLPVSMLNKHNPCSVLLTDWRQWLPAMLGANGKLEDLWTRIIKSELDRRARQQPSTSHEQAILEENAAIFACLQDKDQTISSRVYSFCQNVRVFDAFVRKISKQGDGPFPLPCGHGFVVNHWSKNHILPSLDPKVFRPHPFDSSLEPGFEAHLEFRPDR